MRLPGSMRVHPMGVGYLSPDLATAKAWPARSPLPAVAAPVIATSNMTSSVANGVRSVFFDQTSAFRDALAIPWPAQSSPLLAVAGWRDSTAAADVGFVNALDSAVEHLNIRGFSLWYDNTSATLKLTYRARVSGFNTVDTGIAVAADTPFAYVARLRDAGPAWWVWQSGAMVGTGSFADAGNGGLDTLIDTVSLAEDHSTVRVLKGGLCEVQAWESCPSDLLALELVRRLGTQWAS